MGLPASYLAGLEEANRRAQELLGREVPGPFAFGACFGLGIAWATEHPLEARQFMIGANGLLSPNGLEGEASR